MAENAPSIEERIHALNNPEKAEETAEVSEDTSEEVTEQVAAEEPEEATEEATEEEAVELTSLKDWADYNGVSIEDAYNLTVGTKLGEVQLGKIKDSYVALEEANKAREEANELRERIQKEFEATQTSLKTRLQEAAGVVQALEQEALGKYKGVNWDQLRSEKPHEYAAMKLEAQEAAQRINQMKAAIVQKAQQMEQEQSQKKASMQEELLVKERDLLMKAWPELGDSSKAEAEKSKLRDFLKERGFSDSEIENQSDHRLVLMARDAMRWQQTAKSTDATKKKVVKIAKKVLTPGTKQTKAEQASEANQAARERLRKTGDWRDAAALISKLS